MPNISKEALKDKMLELACVRCKAFKPIELFPSFYYNRDEISKEELEILSKRRIAERKCVTKLDSKYNDSNKEWFIVNAEWLKDWKMFVNNKRAANVFGERKSKCSNVGILDPGPITNFLILDENNQPLEGLIRGKHYRGVNKAVWQQLYNTYCGGPVIRRNEINIYSEEYKEFEPSETDVSIIDDEKIK